MSVQLSIGSDIADFEEPLRRLVSDRVAVGSRG
jgi:hypothetical protein